MTVTRDGVVDTSAGGSGPVTAHSIGGGDHTASTIASLNSKLTDYNIGVPGVNIYVVGKHGNDSNSGEDWNQAFLTFGAAISAASSGDCVLCLDNGIYTERIQVPAGISIHAPNANIISPGGGTITNGAVEMNDNYCMFNTVTAVDGESGVVKPDTTGTARFHARSIVLPGPTSGIGVLNISTTQSGVLLAKVDTIQAGANCSGVGSITQNNGHTHIEAEDVYLNGNGATGVVNAFISSTTVARVAHILETGSFTGTFGINCGAGRIDAIVLELQADTALNAANNTVLSITCDNITGLKTQTGTGVIREATFTQTVP